MNQKQKKEIRNMLASHISFDAPLAKYTTFGIGGPAQCMIYPDNRNELSTLLKYVHSNKIPAIFIGSGSNLLIWDKGFEGVVISLRKTFKELLIKTNLTISVQSGVMLGTMVKEARKHSICGLESLVGVPGTVGGALMMNAGAFGGEISNYFLEAKTMTLDGDIKTYTKEDVQFSYRHSTFPIDEILIEATFKCKKGNPEKILEEQKKSSQRRKSTQPLKYRSAGSIFKNPSKKLAAGYLIEKAGLKGINYGGASISDKHANFIVNRGNATAADVFHLIVLIRQKVAEKFNIKLELEVKLIGFPEKLKQEVYYA